MIDAQLAITFLETVLFFGVLGWAVDAWARSRLVFLYPAYGLVAFGAVAVPATYLAGRFDLKIILGSCVLILAAGIYGQVRYGGPYHFRFGWKPQAVFLAGLSLTLVGLGLWQASKYSIPGGIDSAIHSSIIQGILVQGKSLHGSYPLGMHITILSVERLFHARQELVFLSLYLVFYLSTLASLAAVVDRMIRRPIAGYLALAIGCIDVSLYNNFLNGSGTHLIGVVLSALLLLASIVTSSKSPRFQTIAFAAVLTVIWFFHYPTLFFAIIPVWGWRIATKQTRSLRYLAALGISLVVSIPLQLKLGQETAYIQSVLPGVAGIVLVEVILRWLGHRLARLLFHRLALLILAAISTWLFYHYSSSFLFLPTWYGEVLIQLGFVGLVSAIFSRHPLAVMALIAFGGMSVLHALLHLPAISSLSHVMIELVYYYGFTISLILLGTAGAMQIKQLLNSQRSRQIMIGMGVVYVVLIISSRSFDQPVIAAIISNDRPISRYESSKGFGIFYTKNDAALAAWVKENVPDNGVIANPGGLYNAWSALTEHRSLFATYNVPTVHEADLISKHVRKLMQGESDAEVTQLVNRNVRYVLLPEGFSVALFHPQSVLRHKIGRARFYELTFDRQGRWFPIPAGARTTSFGASIETTGSVVCRYCGNTFYFSDQDVLNEWLLAPADTLTLNIPDTPEFRSALSLYIDHNHTGLQFETSPGTWKNIPGDADRNGINLPMVAGQSVKIRNPNESDIEIYAMALRVKPKPE